MNESTRKRLLGLMVEMERLPVAGTNSSKGLRKRGSGTELVKAPYYNATDAEFTVVKPKAVSPATAETGRPSKTSSRGKRRTPVSKKRRERRKGHRDKDYAAKRLAIAGIAGAVRGLVGAAGTGENVTGSVLHARRRT